MKCEMRSNKIQNPLSPTIFHQHLPLQMPIHCPFTTTRLSQEEFKLVANDVMRHVFDIHNEFGRFFDEQVYKKELAVRMSGVVLELAITVTHDSFTKTYYVDVLVNGGGLFEFKATDSIHPRHRGQTLNYLLLLDLGHGKVINVRPELVQHEFVNCPSRLVELKNPTISDVHWNSQVTGACFLRDSLISLVSDWGAGLDIGLFEEAVTHFLGGQESVQFPIPVIGKKGHVTDQLMRLVAPNVAFKITGLRERLDEFEVQTRKLLQHTTLKTIHWINITQHCLTFRSLT